MVPLMFLVLRSGFSANFVMKTLHQSLIPSQTRTQSPSPSSTLRFYFQTMTVDLSSIEMTKFSNLLRSLKMITRWNSRLNSHSPHRSPWSRPVETAREAEALATTHHPHPA